MNNPAFTQLLQQLLSAPSLEQSVCRKRPRTGSFEELARQAFNVSKTEAKRMAAHV